jgi:formylglycine-generating enzyme required for sulfatase activity
MVRLPEGYCIDSTEVTRSQYAAWLETNPPLPDPADAGCGWNTSFTPAGVWLYEGTSPNNPVTQVDWCDAYAYCKAVGKRLCGKIGGGTNGYNDYANPALSQWFNACSSHGQYTYPYGNTYDATRCDGGDYGVGPTTVPVATLGGCQSPDVGYAGVYDLSGNAAEWEDSCESPGPFVYCRQRGGSFGFNLADISCGDGFSEERDGTSGQVGFRCCSA